MHKYEAKTPDQYGIVHYTEEEHHTWQKLYERQCEVIKHRACDEFIEGIKNLGLSKNNIPQIPDISKSLLKTTGFSVAPVKALISFREFFSLLAHKQFPAATFIRIPSHIDYLKEPDIFHEIFGHCPLLTYKPFADFTKAIGELGMDMNDEERVMLARLYWFTVEFGLINTKHGLRIYGGGILSSKNESIYALESDIPQRHQFDLITLLRTSYRYDEMQKHYFIIDSFAFLFNLIHSDLRNKFKEAKSLGIIAAENIDIRSC